MTPSVTAPGDTNLSDATAADSTHVARGAATAYIFAAYISPIGRVVGWLGVKHHEYADDTQLYVEMTDRDSLDRLSR